MQETQTELQTQTETQTQTQTQTQTETETIDNPEPGSEKASIDVDGGIAAKRSSPQLKRSKKSKRSRRLKRSTPQLEIETETTDNVEPGSETAIGVDDVIAAKCSSPRPKMQETQPTDHPEPSGIPYIIRTMKESGVINEQMEPVSDRLSPPSKKPPRSISSSKQQSSDNAEQQTSNAEEQTNDAEEQNTDSKEQTTDAKEQTNDAEEQTSNSQEQTTDVQEQTADAKEQANDAEEPASNSQEQTTDVQEQTADAKEQANDAEEQTSNSQEQTTDAQEQTSDAKEPLKCQVERLNHLMHMATQKSGLESRSHVTTGERPISIDWARRHWSVLRTIVHDFISNYFQACDGSGKQLSESEKRSIIAALDGWCPQEDWDSLMENFSADKYIRSCLPSKLAEALLHKHLCDHLLTNPFWYLGCDNGSMPSQRTDDLQAPFRNPFGTQVYDLWKSFLRVDAIKAHFWRCETVRLQLANRVGACDEQTRKSAIERFASWILQGPLGLLAREITDAEEIRERHQLLAWILTDAAELTMKLFCSYSDFGLHGLEKPAGPHHKRMASTGDGNIYIKAHQSHRLEEADDRLKSRPPVILIQPALVMRRGADRDLQVDELLLCPGLAMIEDRDREQAE
ncbi:hypothetical protein Egran_00643 [Elaphomyces granulatus]|uniref:Uncharacterized protein n=1 Tax=Elaphomyces granulatus TaxID=519963 RepID=A0A232M5D9_9EURO|nr:hypothetical protein Egran_00643 [Elaphomyces granulatus]